MQDAGGEVVVVDTAPHSDSAALAAAKASDLILIPCRPSILDLESMATTVDLLRTTGKPLWVVLNAVAPHGSETEEAAEAIAALDVSVCRMRIGRRVAFTRALVSGLTAQEYEPRGKAAEIGRLYECISSAV